jgi:hypothetical protein
MLPVIGQHFVFAPSQVDLTLIEVTRMVRDSPTGYKKRRFHTRERRFY